MTFRCALNSHPTSRPKPKHGNASCVTSCCSRNRRPRFPSYSRSQRTTRFRRSLPLTTAKAAVRSGAGYPLPDACCQPSSEGDFQAGCTDARSGKRGEPHHFALTETTKDGRRQGGYNEDKEQGVGFHPVPEPPGGGPVCTAARRHIAATNGGIGLLPPSVKRCF